jgi:hypothetical protein
MPKIIYRLPWLRLKKKEKYEKWRRVVLEKHGIEFN